MFFRYRFRFAVHGCLGYPIRDNQRHFYFIGLSADRIFLTPDFRSARHPQRKTER